jgi:hypothetical protein
MKKSNKKILFSIIMTTLIISMIGFVGLVMKSPIAHAAQSTVDLGTATPFAILANTTITDSPTSTITGNVGLYAGAGSLITGLLCTQVTGTIYARDNTGNVCFSINDPLLLVAKNNLTAAYTDAANRTPVNIVDTELGGQTLTPGVYTSDSTALQISAPTPLVLDAQNDPSAVFIFEGADAEAGALTVGPGGTVSLINEASACNVFWRVYGATIDTTAVFKGNILALTSITVADGADIEGRLLARNGQVTLINDTITVPTCTETSSNGSTSVTPKLPNTGYAPNESITNLLAIGLSASIITAAILGVIVSKKRSI